MRRIQRTELSARARTYLRKRQTAADAKLANGALNIQTAWDSARQTQSMGDVLQTLQSMMGPRQRCMYCMDSHGSDIEHFRPKNGFPQRMFRWRNLLLCCTECGRMKGTQFPRQGVRPLLIDPTKEEPWDHLDFDPVTGNITATFDVGSETYSPKGLKTSNLLQLDRREALAAGYMKTYRQLTRVITNFLNAPTTSDQLVNALLDADEHGLVGWLFKGNGQTEPMPTRLRSDHPEVWAHCVQALTYF